MPENPYDPYRAALENDAHEAVLELYGEHLWANIKSDQVHEVADARSKLTHYSSGHPVDVHREALGAAEKIHMEVAAAGGTPLAAAVAAKEVLQNSLDKGRQYDNKELSASDKLDQHMAQDQQQQPQSERSAEQELEKHFQAAKREVTIPAINPDLQKKQDLGL